MYWTPKSRHGCLLEAFRDGQIDARTEWRTAGRLHRGMCLNRCFWAVTAPKTPVKAQSSLYIVDSLKVTGAKGDLCPGSFMCTGAHAPFAPVESAPMTLRLLFTVHVKLSYHMVSLIFKACQPIRSRYVTDRQTGSRHAITIPSSV